MIFFGVLKIIFMKYKLEKKIGLLEILLVLLILNGKKKILFLKIVDKLVLVGIDEVSFFLLNIMFLK